MSTTDPMLPLPPAVLARLRTAETLRAEVAGLTAERDALRDELQIAAWERDTAQNEASYLRNEVLEPWGAAGSDPRIGRLLTMGDEPPPAPEQGADIALVSLSSGEVYVRAYPNAESAWARYGTYSSSSDFATLAEYGPWVTVDGWRYRDHKERGEASRRLYAAVHSGVPGTGNYVHGWPEATEPWRKTIDDLSAQRPVDVAHPAVTAAWIEAWRNLAGSARSAWEAEHRRLERLQSYLRTTPHPAEWCSPGTAERVCTYCGLNETEHPAESVAEAVSSGA